MSLVDTGSITLIHRGQGLGTDSRERGCQTSIERRGTQGRVDRDEAPRAGSIVMIRREGRGRREPGLCPQEAPLGCGARGVSQRAQPPPHSNSRLSPSSCPAPGPAPDPAPGPCHPAGRGLGLLGTMVPCPQHQEGH